jgi:membrane associated rhomboid family serine protease
VTDPSAAPDAAPSCYRHPDRATYVSCQRCGRHVCPECQNQAAVGVQCPECVRGAQTPAVRRAGGWTRTLVPRRSIVTFVLMGLIVVAYAVQWLTGQWLTEAWRFDARIIGAEPWRLLTSTFLHSPATFIHILFNLYALYVLGPALESFLGRARFLALYLVAGLGGSLGAVALYALAVATQGASIQLTGGFLAPSVVAVGASGAIFGLMGAYIPLRKAIGVNIGQLAIVLGINVVIGFLASGIAWEAHLGGLAVGAAIGAVYRRTRRPDQRRAQVLGVAGIAVAVLVIFAVFVFSAPGYYGL